MTTFLFLLLLVAGANAEKPDVSKWKVYTASSVPSFKMAFPAKVEVITKGTVKAYSSSYRWAPLVASQVIVNTDFSNHDAADMDPNEAMKVFTNEREGKVRVQQVVRTPDGFILVFSETTKKEGVIVFGLHNIHLLNKRLYDVSYQVIASEEASEKQLKEILSLGASVLKTFVPLP